MTCAWFSVLLLPSRSLNRKLCILILHWTCKVYSSVFLLKLTISYFHSNTYHPHCYFKDIFFLCISTSTREEALGIIDLICWVFTSIWKSSLHRVKALMRRQEYSSEFFKKLNKTNID